MLYYTSSSEDEPEIETLNISNDQHYRPVLQSAVKPASGYTQHETHPKLVDPLRVGPAEIPKYGSNKIKHSLPAYDLWKSFYPTYLSEAKFRCFHRPKLRHYNNGPQASKGHDYPEFAIKSLSRHIYLMHRALRRKVIDAIDNTLLTREEIQEKFLLIRKARDLTAKSGELYLFEYCEEFPPVLSQIGMASTIVTYKYTRTTATKSNSKLKANQSSSSLNVDVESSLRNEPQKPQPDLNQNRASSNPQLGHHEEIRSEKHSKQIYFHPMKSGTSIQVIENNLYRAPIYAHKLSDCDFIVIRTRNSFYIRPASGIFTVGQTLPLAIVPSPTDVQIQKFRCDLSNVYMHKLFMTSETRPRSLNINTLGKLFPDYHISVLIRRMRIAGADKAIMKHESVFVQGNSDYGKVSLLDLRNMVKPETYCVNVSMLAARQRLRELNYTESMIHPTKGQSSELEHEVLAAPWNTTKAVISALRGQIYLDFVNHLIDPTCTREGFSCVPWSKSPLEEQQQKEMREGPAPKPSPGASANAPSLVNPLRAKIVQEKIARLATYHKKAQQLFELQSSSLSIQDPLTSDEEDDDEMDEEIENISDANFNQQLEDLEELVMGNRNLTELNHEREEEVRRQMLADFKVDEMNNRSVIGTKEASPKKSSDELTASTLKDKILMITRTYDYNGRKIERTEIVREPRIIALYVKQRQNSAKPHPKRPDLEQSICDEAGDRQNTSIISTRSEGAPTKTSFRPRASSLGPSELCRADGTILRISKKVLDQCRPLRQCRR